MVAESATRIGDHDLYSLGAVLFQIEELTKEKRMRTRRLAWFLQSAYGDNKQFLNQMKALPASEMVPGDSSAPSTLMGMAAALIASGEPICIGLQDGNPLLVVDPPMMGYFYGTEPYQLEHTAVWLEELGEILGAMALNLREIRKQMENDPRTSTN